MSDEEDGTSVVYEAADSAEAGMLERVLIADGIAVTTVVLGDTAYPGILDRHRPHAELRVSPEELARAQEVLAEYLEGEEDAVVLERAEDIEPREGSPRPAPRASLLPVLIPIALFASIVGNVFLLYAFVFKAVESDVDSYDDEGNLVLTSHYAGPYDLWPRSWETYDRAGRRLSLTEDADSDGWPERSTDYDESDGISRSLDANEDGLFERWTYERRGQQLLTAVDEDGDGFVETIECQDEGQRRFIVLDSCRTWLE